MASSFTKLITTYIKAKDSNKPHLMSRIFSQDATLNMIVNSENISFPSKVIGLDNITATLVEDFSMKFENVYTFCLEDTIDRQDDKFICQWLVVMNDKITKEVKIGIGEYIWIKDNSFITSLDIKIKEMNNIDAKYQNDVLDLVSFFPYPWANTYQVSDIYKYLSS